MINLEPDECRVLGVLVEKALTTPDQYPLSLNGLVLGCSQKSNRHPVEAYDEPRVYDAIDAMRPKGLVVEAHLSGSRVAKFRHNSKEVLAVDIEELVLLVEMMLRGPQTVGELRGRASRMRPLESVDQVEAVLDRLMQRDPPYVQRIAPAPGSRAERYAQLFCPQLHPISESTPDHGAPNEKTTSIDPTLSQRVDHLEAEVAKLRDALERIAASLGEADLLERTVSS